MQSLPTIVACIATALAFTASASPAQSKSELTLPKTMAWTAYGTGSGGYTQVVAIGNMLRNRYGTSVRILPGENDVSRMTPLRTGRVDLCACGIASYYGSEGVMLFANPNWGPQRIRVITTSTARFGLGVAAAGDAGIKTPADLKGKRVAYIRGDDALNVGTEAFLAFGGLTWDDVERVNFPGYSRSIDGIIGNQVDAAFTMSVTPGAQQLAASPRGVAWPQLDPDNAAAWKRLFSVAPYFSPHLMTAGAGGVSADNPVPFAGYPYPIIVANADFNSETAYGLIRVLTEEFDQYAGAAPGNEGFALENQNLTWVIPFHDSVVRYYREIGIWTDEMQKHQDELVRRQELLQLTWKAFMKAQPPSDEDQFAEAWMRKRTATLEAAGMNPVFR